MMGHNGPNIADSSFLIVIPSLVEESIYYE
jgi:hypothetical protein